MSPLLQTFADYLSRDDWSFTPDEDRSALYARVQGKASDYRAVFATREDVQVVIVYLISSTPVPEEARFRISEFLTRANYGLHIGNFEMDYRDGEVRYKVSMDIEGGTLADKMITNMIATSVQTLDRYYPGIMAVAFAGAEAERAIEEIESA